MSKAPLYPNEKLRSRLIELGVPRYKHNLAELGEMLPSEITRFRENGEKYQSLITFWKLSYKYCGRIGDFESSDCSLGFSAKSEANIRAKMLVYLITNGIIRVNESIHKRTQKKVK